LVAASKEKTSNLTKRRFENDIQAAVFLLKNWICEGCGNCFFLRIRRCSGGIVVSIFVFFHSTPDLHQQKSVAPLPGQSGYEFFKSQGAVIVNDASDFAGTNSCYLYQGRDVKEDKDRCLKDQILVIAPHEVLISSDTWLKCRKKLMANTIFQQGRKTKAVWDAGKFAKKNLSNSFSRPCRRSSKTFRYSMAGRKKSIRN
jgi:hypothetical protein